jgi:hypothetical protein
VSAALGGAPSLASVVDEVSLADLVGAHPLNDRLI